MEYRVISTDDHIIEAPDTFDRMPAKYRDRQPKIMRGPDGGDGWSFDGSPPRNTFGLNAVAGRPYQDYKANGLTLEEILPGNYDGEAHLKDMDLDGVDAATIYPMASLEGLSMPDREFGVAVVQAYNDWLMDDFCAADPKRLIALPIIPVDDGQELMLQETERVIKKGARGIFLPFFAEHEYYDRYYDDLWKLLSDARVAAAIHRTMGGKAPAGQSRMGAVSPSDAPGLNIAGIVERFFSGIAPLTRMIFTGVFERHANLTFVDAEVNGGWVPFWAQMMEQEFERQRHWANPPLTQNPTNFLGKNVFVTALDDFVGFELAKTDDVLARCMTWSSDYPHSTTLWPKSKDYIKQLTAGMDEKRRHDLVAGNAMRAFALSSN
ncbi:MAG TPA: amidohydrolase family protein [Candidatus Dormibacteraeota bacterium]|nr:amidohydrolase family protein [Candidatus Dormibacteraeota bacterium]